MMPTMIAQIVPVFLLIGTGILLARTGIATPQWTKVLNAYGLYLGFPALIVLGLVETGPSLLISRIPAILTTLGILTAALCVIMAIVRLTQTPSAIGGSLIACSVNGNVGYLGFPLITAILPGSEGEIGLTIALYSLILFSVVIILLELLTGHQRRLSEVLITMVKSPFIISVAAGLVVIGFAVPVPEILAAPLRMIRASVSPVVLISLGVFMHRSIDYRRIHRPVIIIWIIKMVVMPGMFLLIMVLGDGTIREMFRVAALQATMPVVIASFALSDRYQIDSEVVAGSIILTTLTSPFTFPLFASIIQSLV